MAFFETFEDDEDLANQQTQQLGQQGGVIDAPQSTAPTGQQQPGQPTKSGNWTNLISYIDANKGNDARMGEGIKSDVSAKADTVDQKAGQFADGAKQVLASNTVADSGVVAGLRSDPTKVKKEDFERQWTAAFNAPKEASAYEGYGDVSQGYNHLGSISQNTDTFEGKQGLLKETFNRPTYTQGENQLDSFILNSGEGGQKAIQDVRTDISGRQTGWGNLLSSLNTDIGSAAQTTAKTRNDTQAAYNNKVKNLSTNFANYSKRASTEQANNNTNFATLEAQLESKDPKTRAKGYQSIGLEPAVGEYLVSQGFNLERLTDPTVNRKMGDFATPQEAANWLALEELSGVTGGTLASQDFSKGGGDGSYYKANDQFIKAGTEANKLTNAFGKRQATEQEKRDAVSAILSGETGWEYTNPVYEMQQNQAYMELSDDAAATLAEHGIDRDVMNYIRRANAMDHTGGNIDPSQLVKNAKAGQFDVASKEETKKWTALMDILGIKSTPKTNPFLDMELYNEYATKFENRAGS